MNLSIPEEIVTEILSWLPVKSLLRFTCVTKFFNSLISGSNFIDIHRCRSVTRPGGTKFVLHASRFYYTSAQQKEHVQIQSFDAIPFNIPHVNWPRLNCVNGLFCIWESLSNQPAAILNPSTREIRFLPRLNDDFLLCYYSFGFEPEENKYKILATTNHVQESYIKRWIFTLGIDESWRELKSSLDNVCRIPEVYINGVIYKFAFHNGFSTAGFDVKSENFKFIVLENNAIPWCHYELIEVKGKLAAIYHKKGAHEYIHLLVLEQNRKEEEWKSHIIPFPSTWKDIQQEVVLSCRSTSCDGEILFIVNLKSGSLCLCYDVTRQSWRKFEIKGLPKNHGIQGICSYVERLVM